MAGRLSEYPILLYAALVVPMLLLVIWWLADASIWYLMMILLWLGTAFVVMFLPVSSDNNSSN